MRPSAGERSAGLGGLSVPLAEAKNHLSALIARVQQGEEISITRRGVPVARLVSAPARRHAAAERARMVHAALERLQQLRTGLVLEGDLQAIAREGLD
jgi:prevent-host-death family protein